MTEISEVSSHSQSLTRVESSPHQPSQTSTIRSSRSIE